MPPEVQVQKRTQRPRVQELEKKAYGIYNQAGQTFAGWCSSLCHTSHYRASKSEEHFQHEKLKEVINTTPGRYSY